MSLISKDDIHFVDSLIRNKFYILHFTFELHTRPAVCRGPCVEGAADGTMCGEYSLLLDGLSGPARAVHRGNIRYIFYAYSITSAFFQTQSECVNADSKPCCTEDITENCEEMDDTCQWQCKTTTSTAASNTTSGSSPQPTSVTTPSPSTSAQPEERFCESGTDMYMKGFAVISRQLENIYFLYFNSLEATGKMFVLYCCSKVGFWIRRRNL